jgi:prevent-host-death family protein
MKQTRSNHTVAVAELKARLSEYLRAVKAGQAIVVTERGRPVARLVPVSGGPGAEGRLRELVASGAVREPVRRRAPEFWSRARPQDPAGRTLDILLDERAGGW